MAESPAQKRWRLAIDWFFGLRLRWPVIWVQRLLQERGAPRSPLPSLDHPMALTMYSNEQGFDWRPDATRIGRKAIGLDWISHPEVFQARLKSGSETDGDCDDWHFWAAQLLREMESVEDVYLVSSMWDGGGHTFAMYSTATDIVLMDYAPQVVGSWAAGVEQIHERYADGAPVFFVVWETPDLRLVANGVDATPPDRLETGFGTPA